MTYSSDNIRDYQRAVTEAAELLVREWRHTGQALSTSEKVLVELVEKGYVRYWTPDDI